MDLQPAVAVDSSRSVSLGGVETDSVWEGRTTIFRERGRSRIFPEGYYAVNSLRGWEESDLKPVS